MSQDTQPETCPRCSKALRPTDHGLHHLHWALGRPVCPSCWIATQPQRLERTKAREIFDASQFPTAFRKRMWDEAKAALAERNRYVRDRDRAKDELRAEIHHEELIWVTRMPHISQVHERTNASALPIVTFAIRTA